MRFASILLSFVTTTAFAVTATNPQNLSFCGDEGVWIQILGSGALELQNDRAASSYLVWRDNKARLMVDVGSGAALRFDESGAEFTDLDAIVLTQTSIDHTADIPSLIVGSKVSDRERSLPLLGPSGSGEYLATSELITRLMGQSGPYPQLAAYLSFRSPARYRLSVRDVPSVGRQRWTGFITENVTLSSIPVEHGDVPAIAWRADFGDQAVVFAGDFSNRKDTIAKFGSGADALVLTHELPVGAAGSVREQFVIPSQIGALATRMGVRFVILGGRAWRTFGREWTTRNTINESFEGTVVFADELECWGL